MQAYLISGLSLIFQNLFVSIRALGSLKFFDLNIKQVTKTVLYVCMALSGPRVKKLLSPY